MAALIYPRIAGTQAAGNDFIGAVASANCPAATALPAGSIIKLTDVGSTAAGSLWVSDGTSLQPSGGSPIVLARSSVQVTDAASGNELIYAKLTLPAIITSANRHYRIRAGFSCTSSANTKTYRVHLSANSYAIGGTVVSGTIMAAMTGQNSVTSHSFGAVISNRNSVSSQAGFYMESRSPGTISVGSATASIDTSAAATYLYITAQKATAGETITLEDYVVECF